MYIVHKTVTILLYSCLLSGDSVPAAREIEDVQVAGLLWCYMQRKTMTSTGEIILYITQYNSEWDWSLGFKILILISYVQHYLKKHCNDVYMRIIWWNIMGADTLD